jgi:hypothetical protein
VAWAKAQSPNLAMSNEAEQVNVEASNTYQLDSNKYIMRRAGLNAMRWFGVNTVQFTGCELPSVHANVALAALCRCCWHTISHSGVQSSAARHAPPSACWRASCVSARCAVYLACSRRYFYATISSPLVLCKALLHVIRAIHNSIEQQARCIIILRDQRPVCAGIALLLLLCRHMRACVPALQ